MSDKKHTTSLLPGRSWLVGRLSASWRVALGGSLWLLGCLALALWLGREEEAPFRTGGSDAPAQAEYGHARALESAAGDSSQPFHTRLTALDMAVEEAMSAALPKAHWRREILPAASHAGDRANGPENLPEISGMRAYTITGPCAPLRLGLALLGRFAAHTDVFSPHAGGAGLTAQAAPHADAASSGTEKAGAGRAASDASFLRDGNIRLCWTSDGQLEIRDHGRLTHRILFPGREGELAGLDIPLPRPALALVIDDMGQSLEAAGALAALPYAVTPTIWPHAPHATSTAELAAQRRMDVLVHVPMEALPRKDGTIPNPGQGALKVGMEPHRIQAILEANLASLPTAVGLNNHMGSAFTGDAAACRIVCARLAGTGFFLLDSLTTPGSLLAQQARALGLVSASRDVFLDTYRQTPAILKALDQAAVRARIRGYAIAIGHPYAETLSALRAWQNSEGVALVPLRRLIWNMALEQAETATNTAADSALQMPVR